MIRRLMYAGLSAVLLFGPAARGQSTSSDDLQKQINALNETEKAILKELRDIKTLLQQQQQPARAAADALPAEPLDISKNAFRGAGSAKVALIEFSDFQCPFCGRYDKDTYPQLLKDYVDAGKVKYVWHDLPLDIHKYAEKAAEAAHCAGEQGKFWEMHDRLFANQQNLTDADLLKYATEIQLNGGAFQACLNSSRYASQMKREAAEAMNDGVSGTPTFMVGVVQPNGAVKIVKKLVGAKSYSDFKNAIDALLAAQ